MGRFKNLLLTGAFLAGSTITGCTFNKNKIDYQEPTPVVYCLDERNSKKQENKKESLEKVVDKEKDELKEFRKFPEIELKFKVDPLLDPYSGADNTLSACRAAMKGVDSLIKKNNLDSVLARIVKMIAIDYTLTYFTATYQHEEFGHVYRLKEQGLKGCSHMFLRNPFFGGQVPYASYTHNMLYTQLDKPGIPAPEHQVPCLLTVLGGIEAETVRNNRLAEDMMKKDRHSYYDALMYLHGKGHFLEAFCNYNGPDASKEVSKELYKEWEENDVFGYCDLMYKCFNVDVNPSVIRDGGLWCMLDPLLGYSFIHTLFHFGEGVRQLPNPKFIFTTDFNLAPYGPEHTLNLFYRNDSNLIKISGRKGKGKNYGLGFELVNVPLKTKFSDKVNVGVDLWSQKFPRKMKKYNGFGFGVNAEVEKDIGKDVSLNFGVRAKTRGYNLGDRLHGNANFYLGIGSKW